MKITRTVSNETSCRLVNDDISIRAPCSPIPIIYQAAILLTTGTEEHLKDSFA